MERTHHCSICGKLTTPVYVFMECAKTVYASMYCRKHTLEKIAELPITAILTGETVRIVEWKNNNWIDEAGDIVKEGNSVNRS
jgi:hypothetical protein